MISASKRFNGYFPCWRWTFWTSLSAQHIHCVIIFSLVFTKNKQISGNQGWYVASKNPPLPN